MNINIKNEKKMFFVVLTEVNERKIFLHAIYIEKQKMIKHLVELKYHACLWRKIFLYLRETFKMMAKNFFSFF